MRPFIVKSEDLKGCKPLQTQDAECLTVSPPGTPGEGLTSQQEILIANIESLKKIQTD